MFKQKVCGFQRKTLPFTMVVGLFLLTISIYEAIYGLRGVGIISYIMPAIVLFIVCSLIFMLSFVSYEYRLMYNCLIIRKVLFGKTRKTVTVILDDKAIAFTEVSQAETVKIIHRMCLPFFERGKNVRLDYKTKEGKSKSLVFQPCAELSEMINNYRIENVIQTENP